jgi:hypothetical protein
LNGLQTIAIGGQPFTAAAQLLYTHNSPTYLPVAGYVEEELRSAIEEKLAQQWMNKAMLDVKEDLASVTGSSADLRFQDRLKNLKNKYGRYEVSLPRLAAAGAAVIWAGPTPSKEGAKGGDWISGITYGKTTKLRNEYDIDTDPGLKVLLDSFDKQRYIINTIEGRAGKPDMLKEGDFAKLFFGTDSIGVGAGEAYAVGVWPPTLTPKKKVEEYVSNIKPAQVRQFDTSDQPILFWKSVKKGLEKLSWKPEDPDFMAFAIKQYKMDKAREMVVKAVKEIATEVKEFQRQEKHDVFATKLRDLALKKKLSILSIENVAPLVKTTHRGAMLGEEVTDYEPYALKRGLIPFAREDMVKQLLLMTRSQKEPIKVDIGELDELNKGLFLGDLKADEKKATYQVQVLTNKPRTVYYIVTLARERPPSKDEFIGTVLGRAFMMGKEQNRFVDVAQEELGKDVMAEMTKQLREQFEVWESEGAKKQIKADSGAQ